MLPICLCNKQQATMSGICMANIESSELLNNALLEIKSLHFDRFMRILILICNHMSALSVKLTDTSCGEIYSY